MCNPETYALFFDNALQYLTAYRDGLYHLKLVFFDSPYVSDMQNGTDHQTDAVQRVAQPHEGGSHTTCRNIQQHFPLHA